MNDNKSQATIGAVILAAGASRRLGTPKQLLAHRDGTFISNVAQVAMQSQCQYVWVVLGAYADKIRPALRTCSAQIVYNPQWQQGMSTSIVAAIAAVPCHIDAVILMPCDQPFITTTLLNHLIRIHCTSHYPIVACSYKGTVGIPALFARSFFDELLSLNGDRGAKKIIAAHPHQVATIKFVQGAIDVDTRDDYLGLGQLFF